MFLLLVMGWALGIVAPSCAAGEDSNVFDADLYAGPRLADHATLLKVEDRR